MIYLISLSVLFTLSFVFYSKWQFIDGRRGRWHFWGAIMRALPLIIAFLVQYLNVTWKDFLLAGSINIILWELLINKIALKTNWLHIGTTSYLDLKLGKWKWLIYSIPLITSIIIKLL